MKKSAKMWGVFIDDKFYGDFRTKRDAISRMYWIEKEADLDNKKWQIEVHPVAVSWEEKGITKNRRCLV